VISNSASRPLCFASARLGHDRAAGQPESESQRHGPASACGQWVAAVAAGFRECQDQDHACSHAPGAPAATKHRLATSRAPRPHQTSQPGRGAPPRRSVKARTRAGGFFRRATACALTYSPSARRGEAQARTRLLPSSPHGTPLYVGDAIMAPPLLSPRPIGGASAGPDGRRVRVRARAGVSSATDDGHEHSALLSLAPADTVDHAWRWRHRASPVTPPIFVCVRLNLPVCLSVLFTLFSLETGDRSIIGRACMHGRSPSQ